MRAEIVGAAVSSTIVSVAAADQLPTASMNWTNTVLLPSPVASVHDLVAAKASAVEYVVPVFEKRICVTALSASVAASDSVTVLLFVAAAPPFMRPCRMALGCRQ